MKLVTASQLRQEKLEKNEKLLEEVLNTALRRLSEDNEHLTVVLDEELNEPEVSESSNTVFLNKSMLNKASGELMDAGYRVRDFSATDNRNCGFDVYLPSH